MLVSFQELNKPVDELSVSRVIEVTPAFRLKFRGNVIHGTFYVRHVECVHMSDPSTAPQLKQG